MSSLARPDTDAAADLVLTRVGLAFSRAYGHFALLLDRDFRIEWGSETVEKIFGWQDAVGRNAVDLVHSDDLGIVLEAMAYHDTHAEDYVFYDPMWKPDVSAIRVQCQDGSFVLCEVAVFNHMGDPEIGALLITGRIADDRSDLPLAIDLLGCGAGPDEVLPVVARLVDRTVDGVRSQVVWWDGSEEVVMSAPDAPAPPAPPSALVAAACATGELQTYVDLPAAGIDPVAGNGERFGSVWIAPVVAPGRDEVVGCVVVWCRLPLDLVTGPQQPIHQAVRLASLAIVDHHAKTALRWEANHDSLTSLTNRAGFHACVAETDARSSLLYVDLDDFKAINDNFGHHAGDQVLAAVGARLAHVVRPGDFVGRLGGDEFAVAAPGLPADQAAGLVKRVRDAVESPISVDGAVVAVKVSIGVAGAVDEDSLETILERGDDDMFVRKRTRR